MSANNLFGLFLQTINFRIFYPPSKKLIVRPYVKSVARVKERIKQNKDQTIELLDHRQAKHHQHKRNDYSLTK